MPAQPAGRAGPADRRDARDGRLDGRRAGARWSGGPRRSPTLPGRGAGGRAGHARRAATRARSSPSCGPRIVWDRATGMLTGRPGAQRLAVTSGGTIPDRGLFGVFLAGGERGPVAGSASWTRRWSTSRGSATCSRSARRSWRIEDITPDRVLVSPAPGPAGQAAVLARRHARAGRPSWAGRIGAFVRELGRAAPTTRRASGSPTAGLDECAAGNLLAYLAEQREATGHVPTTARWWSSGSATSWATGGWWCTRRTARRCTRPWALAIAARLRERYGVDVQAMHADDGIVLRLPDVETRTARPDARREPVCSTPTRSRRIGHRRARRLGAVRRPVPGVRRAGAAAAAAQTRPAAAAVAAAPAGGPAARGGVSSTPSFPIVLEAVRECLQDVFDVPGAGRS